MFQRNYEFRKSKNQKDNINIAKWCMAKAHRYLKNIEKSLTMQYELKDEAETEGRDVGGYIFEELGELHLLKNDEDKYGPYSRKAYEILSKNNWLQANEKERLERMKVLGGL